MHYDRTPGDGMGTDNAYWSGAEMLYGDGYTNFKPLTSLDVCAHEIGHGVCASTANLAYQAESGALNEGFSDIWGASVEQYTAANLGLVKSTWLIGEEIVNYGLALRSMSNPKSIGQPGYYKGQYWVTDPGFYNEGNDWGGVHTNSGVLNRWFYILSQGESGTNEGGNAYAVTGIGINDAARIAYRAESVYLQAASKFEDARRLTLKAAEDLFGVCSAQAVATTKSWYAVGVGGNNYFATPLTPSITATQLSGYNEPTMVRFKTTNNIVEVRYDWYVDGSFYESTSFNEFDYYFPCRVTKTITCVLTSCAGSSGISNGIPITGECNRTKPMASYTYSPNPANDEIVVSSNEPTAGTANPQQGLATTSTSPMLRFTVQLYNIFGQLVRTAESENDKVRLKLADLPSGLYTLRTGSGPDALNAHIQVTH